jgi:hypothetical protein
MIVRPRRCAFVAFDTHLRCVRLPRCYLMKLSVSAVA